MTVSNAEAITKGGKVNIGDALPENVERLFITEAVGKIEFVTPALRRSNGGCFPVAVIISRCARSVSSLPASKNLHKSGHLRRRKERPPRGGLSTLSCGLMGRSIASGHRQTNAFLFELLPHPFKLLIV